MKREEFDAIRGEFYPPSFRDPGLIPECFVLALDSLGQIAMGPHWGSCEHRLTRTDDGVAFECTCPVRDAEQALRRMVQRAVTGTPLYESEDIRG